MAGKTKLRFSNTYDDGHECENTKEIDTPGDGEEALEEWWDGPVFDLTGCACKEGGHPDGDAHYEVTVIESSNPSLVGKTNEWQG